MIPLVEKALEETSALGERPQALASEGGRKINKLYGESPPLIHWPAVRIRRGPSIL
jgi:hypothetical protein